MAIFRKVKDGANPYVMINKEMLNNPKLSMKAKGLLSYMLSMPDDWQFYESELEKHFTDKRDSIRSGIKELIKQGYIIRSERKRDEKGRMCSYDYDVYENNNHIGFSNIGLSNIGESPTTNKYLTNNDINNILHQLDADDYLSLEDIQETLSLYCLLKFNKRLRQLKTDVDISGYCEITASTFVEFLVDNITEYDRCNFDYLNKIQGRLVTYE